MKEIQPVRAPKAYRLLDHALVAGVAAGLSAHFRIPVWVIRVGFVLTCFWKFSGAVLYVLLWLIMPRQEKTVPIGLLAAERRGLRTSGRRIQWPRLLGWVASFLIGTGIAWLIRLYDSSVVGRFGLVGVVAGLGLGLVWLSRETAWPRWGKVVTVVVGGVLILAVGTVVQARLLVSLAASLDWRPTGTRLGSAQTVFALSLFVSGTTIVAFLFLMLPWLLNPARSETDKQAALIAQTRADMAAHLHDSVLQTLAVIQKQASDPKAVAQLARRQEKELREWLYGDQPEEESATTALKEVIAELEATYPVAVELVTVGDYEMTVVVDALVRAAREAILNAAKHSGATQIDVYAEINDQMADLYVRDRGRGFLVDDIGDDRMGIRGSIIDRMSRYGGQVDIRSTVGEGTEIHLSMPLEQKGNNYG